MRRLMVAVPVLAALLAPSGVLAAPPVVQPGAWQAAVQPVQYYGGGYGGERRYHRRQARRAHEQARIDAAARREARRIEIERGQRRAYRRERYGYYRGF